jgi:hypothetical protein
MKKAVSAPVWQRQALISVLICTHREIPINIDLIRRGIKKTNWRHEKTTAAETFLQRGRLHSKQGWPTQTTLPRKIRMAHHLRYFAITLMLFIALSFTFERQAHAYVDPGSGLLIFQGISAIFSGALFYFRRRLRSLFGRSPKSIPQSSRPS